MSRRRIARRLASITGRQNTCMSAESSQRLATKVLHLLSQPFPARRRVGGPWDTRANLESHSGLAPRCTVLGGACRLAWFSPTAATPYAPTSLATKDTCGGAR